MAKLEPGNILGKALCEVFGLHPDVVNKMVLTIVPNSVAQLEITRLIQIGDIEGLETVLEQYELHRIE